MANENSHHENFADALTFEEVLPGINLATLAAGPVEVQVARYAAGAEIPMHSHSNDVIHLIISGKIQFGDLVLGPGADYRCGGFEYTGAALEDSSMLLIQPIGTEFHLSEGS